MTDLAAPLPDPELRRRLRRLSRFVRALILFGATLLVGYELWSWSSPERAAQQMQHVVEKTFHVGTQSMLLGALCTLVPVLVLLLALQRLWGLFGEYEQGRVFSHRALVCLRGFARWLLVDAFVSPAYEALLSVVATWDNGVGRRELNINVGSEDYVMLLFGLVVLAISSVMAEAARVAEDNAGFV